jgi:DNA polymerase
MTDFPKNFPQEIIPELISYLKSLEQKGIRSLYLDHASSTEAVVEDAPTEQGREIVADDDVTTPVDAATAKAKTSTYTKTGAGKDVEMAVETVAARLSEIESIVSTCEKCELHTGRTQSVFGVGNPATRVMFIGEGPGRDEDLRGEPFVGRSGQLLTKILAAIDLERKDVYITNIVKCRPPQNRDPREEEVRCCEKYLVDQIELIQPRIICALGRVAAQWLLQTKDPLATLRNADNEYCGIPVLVTYHPAALLRNPGLKKGAWEDFKRLRAIITADD